MQSHFFKAPYIFLSLLALNLLTACVSAPTGPTITIMPREGKSFEEFKKERDEEDKEKRNKAFAIKEKRKKGKYMRGEKDFSSSTTRIRVI